MEALEYQKRLAEFEERISFHKLQVEQLEHEKARFVLSVLDATLKNRTQGPTVPGVPTVVGSQEDAR